jgi:multidrug efflux pump subunit AcrB
MIDRIVKLSVFNPVFVNLLFIIVIAAGVMGARNLPREQFPEVSLDMVSIDVVYPGATATDVEELVVRPIEEALDDVNDVKRVESVAAEGTANVIVTFLAGKDLQDGRSEVEKAVATLDDLPEDSETPKVREMKLEIPVLAVAIVGDRAVREHSDRISEELRDIPGVASAIVSGLTERRIVVEMDETRLRALQLRPVQITAAIQAARVNVPAGSIERGGTELFVKTDHRLTSAADVEEIPLAPGSPLRVGDVAAVRDIEEQPDTRIVVDGKPAVQIVVAREEGADPLGIREATIALLPELAERLPGTLDLKVSEDYTSVIRDRLRTVAINGLTGAFLVMLVLFVMSGFRQALLALWGMPVSYLCATFLMDKTDITVNVMSTFGLLIATGIIVDDAIVVIENTQRHMEMGKSRIKAAIDGTKEVLAPVTVAVLTTCFAFMPLTMVGGTMGRVMKILPLVVIFCLLGSLIEAIFILPGHMAHYASKDAAKSRTARLVERMRRVYRPVVELAIRRRWILSFVVALGFFGTLGVASTMPVQIGAPGKPFELNLSYELPAGVDREVTRERGEQLIALVEEDLGEFMVSHKLRVGSVRDRMSQFLESGANLGQIRWEFEMSDELQKAYPPTAAKLKNYLERSPDLSSYKLEEMQAGPPSDADVTARVRGRDPKEISAVVEELKRFLRTVDATSQVDDNSGIGKETFRVVVNQDRASLYGMTKRDVAQGVRSAIDGVVATEVSIDETQVEIVVRYARGQRLDQAGLNSLAITAPNGTVVRLDQVATLERTREFGFVRRRDGQRTIAVTCDVDETVITPVKVSGKVQDYWDENVSPQHPDLTLSFGGETEDLTESLNDLPAAFLLAIGLIYIALALQFRSYMQPLIILCAVPFGIIGAIWGLFSMGYPLSLFAMFGIVALSGIVVNDSLVMVDFINQRRRAGVKAYEAAVDGALNRLRPIVSTTLTTCFGLGPLAIGLGGKDEILAPMAISIAAGLGISTGLVLLAVPSIYMQVEDVRLLFRRVTGAKEAPVNPEQELT